MPLKSLKTNSVVTLLFAANVLADSTTDYLHPSFLFLGFRGSSVVKLRPSALLDTFDRIVTVHKSTYSNLSDFWVYTGVGELSRISRWLSNKCTWVFRDWMEGELFYRWRGRYFVVADPYFDKVIQTFLACNVVYLLGSDTKFAPFMAARGALVFNIAAPDSSSNCANFSLYASFVKSPLLFIHYCRMLSYVLMTTRRIETLY